MIVWTVDGKTVIEGTDVILPSFLGQWRLLTHLAHSNNTACLIRKLCQQKTELCINVY